MLPSSIRLPALLLLSVLACLVSCAYGSLVNVTIDDTTGDPDTGERFLYSPSSLWTPGQSCTNCAAHPDAKLAHGGTWHEGHSPSQVRGSGSDSTYLSAAITFTGTAVYVYCILAPSDRSPPAATDLSFYIDGELSGTFVRVPGQISQTTYNVPVYVNESLSAKTHSFVLASGQQGVTNSLVLLDYLVYSRNDGPTTTLTANLTTNRAPDLPTDPLSDSSLPPITPSAASASTPPVPVEAAPGERVGNGNRTGIIAGATVGGIIAVALIVILFTWRRLRASKANPNHTSPGDGFLPEAPAIINADPATSGWTEGTWADEDGHPPRTSIVGSSGTKFRPFSPLGREPSGRARKRNSRGVNELAPPMPPLPSFAADGAAYHVPPRQMSPAVEPPTSASTLLWSDASSPASSQFTRSRAGTTTSAASSRTPLRYTRERSNTRVSHADAHPFASASSAHGHGHRQDDDAAAAYYYPPPLPTASTVTSPDTPHSFLPSTRDSTQPARRARHAPPEEPQRPVAPVEDPGDESFFGPLTPAPEDRGRWLGRPATYVEPGS